MQNIEPDQVQLEHTAPQEPASHTEPLQYAPVASNDHDRRFQKVRTPVVRCLDGVRQVWMSHTVSWECVTTFS